MTADYIRATGNLLATYHSDLRYILNFQRYKRGHISTNNFVKKDKGTFYQFLIEFRVARNFSKGQSAKLLDLTSEWVDSASADNVDSFAKQLKQKGFTHGNIATVLASKVLFLNNPWTILPLDSRAKNTVRMSTNIYADYLPLVDSFKDQNRTAIKKCLYSVNRHLSIIESEFGKEIKNILAVRQNRFTDKILWTLGGEQ